MSKTYQPKKRRYRRRLPHWQEENGVYAVVFRLAGSLPKAVVDRLKKERKAAIRQIMNKGLSEEIAKTQLRQTRQFYFGKFDDLLDNNHTGPHFLKEPKVAMIVEDAITHFDGDRYKIIDYTIMSNHVHLTFYKLTREVGDILGSIKKFSARQINILHHQVGRNVWQIESYDHLVRDRADLTFYHTYTLENAVKAKIVSKWEDYPFTYTCEGFEEFYQPQILCL